MHYEILARFDEATGAYRGSHYLAAAGQPAQPIPLSGLPAEIAALNAGALNALELQRVDIEGHAAAFDALKSAHAEERRAAAEASAAQIAELEKALSETRQTLALHQAISDALVNEARQAIAAGDHAAVLDVLYRAGLNTAARERAKIEAQMAVLAAQLANVTTEPVPAPIAEPAPAPTPVFSGALSTGTGTASGTLTLGTPWPVLQPAAPGTLSF